jgi:SAM-dependent methyltransferase
MQPGRPLRADRHDVTVPQVARFSADPAHVTWLGTRIVRWVASPPRRVLDIGCGDGALLLYLAGAFPGASLVGVDLSASGLVRDRLTLIRGDYLTTDAGRFDLVVASSSLQGIEAATDALAGKLARDVAPGGRFMHVTPYRSPYNHALNALRRGLRPMRGTVTDRMILTMARVLHPDQPRAKLMERVEYMYLILRHYECTLRAALERRGFVLEHTEQAPHTSPGQPQHRFAVMSAPAR